MKEAIISVSPQHDFMLEPKFGIMITEFAIFEDYHTYCLKTIFEFRSLFRK